MDRRPKVEISFVTYNPQYGLYSFAGANFFFNRGGHIHKLVLVKSSFAHLIPGLPWYLVGLTFACDKNLLPALTRHDFRIMI